MPLHPHLAVRADLFLPHRHDLLQPINPVACGLEHAGIAVRCRARDEHGGRPRIERPDPLDDGHALDVGPAFADLVGNLLHLSLGHRDISLVFEARGLVRANGIASALSHAAHHPREETRRTGGGEGDAGDERVEVNGVVGNTKDSGVIGNWGLAPFASLRGSPRIGHCATGDGREQGHFVAVV